MKGHDVLFSANSDEWHTPLDFFAELNKIFGFTLDPCTMPTNPLGVPTFYTKEVDGLSQKWSGHRVFVNPPYSDTGRWMRKCYEESQGPELYNDPIVVLIPARTDTAYFHNYVWGKACSVMFIRGRLKFGGQKNSAPFPSALIAFNADLRGKEFAKMGHAVLAR